MMLTFEEFENLCEDDVIEFKLGDEWVRTVCVDDAFYNADSSEPGWEVETRNGFISIQNEIRFIDVDDTPCKWIVEGFGRCAFSEVTVDSKKEAVEEIERRKVYMELKNYPENIHECCNSTFVGIEIDASEHYESIAAIPKPHTKKEKIEWLLIKADFAVTEYACELEDTWEIRDLIQQAKEML